MHILDFMYMLCICCLTRHILQICSYFQVQALLHTLLLLTYAKHGRHWRMYLTLLVGHKKYPGEQHVCCWPFKGRQLQKSNSQDMVIDQSPAIHNGGFRLRINNVWFCKVLFHFTFVSQNNQARKQHNCAFVPVLEEYKGRRRPGCIYLYTSC